MDPDIMLQREMFYVIYMNIANKVIDIEYHSIGAANYTVVDVPSLVRRALLISARNVIMIHNHPSGNAVPSEADILLYTKVKSALRFFDMNLADNFIISGCSSTYYSFADEGRI